MRTERAPSLGEANRGSQSDCRQYGYPEGDNRRVNRLQDADCYVDALVRQVSECIRSIDLDRHGWMALGEHCYDGGQLMAGDDRSIRPVLAPA